MNGRPHGLPGSFRTLPNAEISRNEEHNPDGLFNFRFQIGSCANQNPLHGVGHRTPTYENLNRDWAGRVDFHIMNGDWLYEELRAFPPEAWRLAQGRIVSSRGRRDADDRRRVGELQAVLEPGCLAKWHRNVPSYFTFDDHELVNDILRAKPESDIGGRCSRHRDLVRLSGVGEPGGAFAAGPFRQWQDGSGERSVGRH